MSAYEMQRIDKPTILNALWNAYPAGHLPYRRKWFIEQSQQNYFIHFIEAIIFV
jgi:hypothetical protein